MKVPLTLLVLHYFSVWNVHLHPLYTWALYMNEAYKSCEVCCHYPRNYKKRIVLSQEGVMRKAVKSSRSG